MTTTTDPLDVLVIGAGQAGLALGRHLQRQGARFLLVDAGDRIGDVWRSRWDSLRLFTAAEHDGLPDLPFPAPAGTYPGKDAVADYLEAYARTFDLPVRLGTRGHPAAAGRRAVRRRDHVRTADRPPGRRRHRPVLGTATPGARQQAGPGRRPAAQLGLSPPEDLPLGHVLVVGAGNSGVQIAEELAATGRTVALAIGSRPRTVPQRPLGRDLFWWLTRTGLIRATVDSRLGRRFRDRRAGHRHHLARPGRAGRDAAAAGGVGGRAHRRPRRRVDRGGRRGRLGDRLPGGLVVDRRPRCDRGRHSRARARGQPGARPVLPGPALAAHPWLRAARVRGRGCGLAGGPPDGGSGYPCADRAVAAS